MNDFFNTIRVFLLEYLPKQRSYSNNTIRSYRQALNLLIEFIQLKKHLKIKDIGFDIITRELIIEFLDWLEQERNCSINTRNQRLMAIRAFFNFSGDYDCTNIALSINIQKVRSKKQPTKIVEHLSENALKIFLLQPDSTTKIGLRNLCFMILMYDTAARCGELLNLKLSDLDLDTQYPIAYLHGKGNKTRTVPLSKKTVQYCKQYISIYHTTDFSTDDAPLFYTVIHGKHQPMSPDTVALFFKKYGNLAYSQCSEMPERMHPHILRHTRAMHLYQHGMPLMLLSDYMGHSNVETTRIYAYADTEMKRNAINKADATLSNVQHVQPIWANDEEMILKLSGLA